MLKINRQSKTLEVLDTPSLGSASISERYDLQEFICNSPRAFFAEIGLDLFVIGKEIPPSKTVADRIDILCLDKEGNAIIVELKRGNHKLHLLQAISYAGMVSHWLPGDFAAKLGEERTEKLSEFLEVDIEDINRGQRIVLLAEAFDYSVLVSAEWLSDQHGASVTCCRISLVTDSDTQSEYLVCTSVYPNPELAQQAVSRRPGKAPQTVAWEDWDSALENIQNPAVVEFFRAELSKGRENYLGRRVLHFYVNGKRRLGITARQKLGYCWQHSRFDGDLEFWQKRLSNPDDVVAVKDGECLRAFLRTKEDFAFFAQALSGHFSDASWRDSAGTEDGDGEI